MLFTQSTVRRLHYRPYTEVMYVPLRFLDQVRLHENHYQFVVDKIASLLLRSEILNLSKLQDLADKTICDIIRQGIR